MSTSNDTVIVVTPELIAELREQFARVEHIDKTVSFDDENWCGDEWYMSCEKAKLLTRLLEVGPALLSALEANGGAG
jgi:hypothetical protein